MQNFIGHFIREGHGVWSCIEPATLDLPSGRIEVTPGSRFTYGTMFMGVDLAKLLEEHFQKTRRG